MRIVVARWQSFLNSIMPRYIGHPGIMNSANCPKLESEEHLRIREPQVEKYEPIERNGKCRIVSSDIQYHLLSCFIIALITRFFFVFFQQSSPVYDAGDYIYNRDPSTMLTYPGTFYQPWTSHVSPYQNYHMVSPVTEQPKQTASPDSSWSSSPPPSSPPSYPNNRIELSPMLQAPHTDAAPEMTISHVSRSASPVSDTDSGHASGSGCEASPSSSTSPIEPPTTADSTPILPVRKNSRTNYSPKQIRALEKIFMETPYPDADVMEQLSREYGIPEKNLKIWFQNKRARWRKRVRENKPVMQQPVYPQYSHHVKPYIPDFMMSPSAMMSSSTLPSHAPAVMPSMMPYSSLLSPSSFMSPVASPQYVSNRLQF